jgi:tRNA (cmo5U34)-methyltransferase
MDDKNPIPKYSGPEIEDNHRLMTKKEIKERFDNETASIYSQRVPIWIPEYKKAINLLVTTIQRYCPKKAQFIDLGAGTGNASRSILEKIPDCSITLVDFSNNMLNEVENLLVEFKGRYSIRVDDFHHIEFTPERYDGVYSTFALHHTRGIESYRKLYRNIYSWLKPDGIFICCDVVEGDNKEFTILNEQGWHNYLINQDFTTHEIEKIFSNYHKEDTPISLKNHINSLQKVGFRDIDVLWKRFNLALYAAVK